MLEPVVPVDPEVWSLAESAREAATIGDHERASTQVAAALTRARSVGRAELDPHRAET